MGLQTAIAWAHHTVNPWWGCEEVSTECALCYAKAWDKRLGGDHWADNAPRRAIKSWSAVVSRADTIARKTGERQRLFCMSMGDIFEDVRPLVNLDGKLTGQTTDDRRREVWKLVELSADTLDWLFLTKRPENVQRMIPWKPGHWPANAWLGVTGGTNATLRQRLPIAIAAGASLTFVSCEPMLEAIDWQGIDILPDWVIFGGESNQGGKRGRPFNPWWAMDGYDRLTRDGVAFFLKQMGSNPIGVGPFHDDAGADMSEWPELFRVQQLPR